MYLWYNLSLQKTPHVFAPRRGYGQPTREVIVPSIPQTSGIYKIVCAPTGKVYVGSATDLRSRHNRHFRLLRMGEHYNKYLQSAWNKYGEAAFEFIVIELILLSFLLEREQYWIDKLKACNRKKGFNLYPLAGSSLGYRHTEETRQKMREAHKGVHRSDEHRRSLSVSLKGRVRSAQTVQRIRDANLRRPLPSKETRQKMSDTHKGRPRTEANTRAIIAAHSKQWIVTDPFGVEHAVTGLAGFCREHGLDRSSLRSVANGEYRQHRGWKCRRG